MNTPMRKDDPARLELIAKTQPEMLLPHHWQEIHKMRERMETLMFPTSDVQPDQTDRQAA